MNYQNYIPHQNLTLSTNKKIVLVGGCFDILHYGHIQFLEKSRQKGGYLVVALEPDERISNHKNRIPMHNQQQRMCNLLALRHIDHVILLPSLHTFDDYFDLVKTIKPHVIAITAGDPQTHNKQKQADTVGAQLVVVTDRIEPFSSSAMKHVI